MILIVPLFLWLIGAIILFKDYKTESTKWAASIAFLTGIGSFSTFWHENFIKFLIENYNITENTLKILRVIDVIMSNTAHNVGPYLILIYGLSFANIVPRKRKWLIYVLLFIPSMLSFIILPLKPNDIRSPYEVMMHFRSLSYWAFPYMIGCSIFIIYAYFKEKSLKLKRHKLLTAIIVVPLITYAAFANMLFRAVGIDNSWRYFIILMPIQFLCFLYFAKKYGVMGVKMRFERYKFTFNDIINNISDSFIAIDETYTVVEVNKTFVENFGTNKKFKSFDDIILNSILKDYKDDLRFLLKNQKSIEISVNTEEEKFFEVECTAIEINNEFHGAVFLFKDITDHKRNLKLIEKNQEQIIENARLESLGNLIGGIAHNLKTPLMSSSGAIDIISNNINKSINLINESNIEQKYKAEISDYFGKIDKWKTHIKDYLVYMNEVISTVRDQIHIDSNDKLKFSIIELINKTNILMNEELKKHKCVIKYKLLVPEETEISGSINYLLQVLNILITNAKDAYEGEEGIIELGIEKDESIIIIRVKDYGKGILGSVEGKIFNEMVTTKGKDGTGLGLYISKSIIKTKFNGNIGFNSDEIGSTFYIEIPQEDK